MRDFIEFLIDGWHYSLISKITLIISGSVFLFSFVAIMSGIEDSFFSYPIQHQGIVLSVEHVPAYRSSGTSVSYTGNGNMGTTVTDEYHPEKFNVIIQDGNEIIFATTKNKYLFYHLNKGNTVLYKDWKGKLTGIDYGATVG